jgi:hypothetical protein
MVGKGNRLDNDSNCGCPANLAGLEVGVEIIDTATEAVRLFTEEGLSMAQVCYRLKITKLAFYMMAFDVGISRSSIRKHQQNLPIRGGERRDCKHYYGDGGCLHKAAYKNKLTVPCHRCEQYEWADNSFYHGINYQSTIKRSS